MTKGWQEGFCLRPERTEQSSELRTAEEKQSLMLGELVAERESGGEIFKWVGERKKIDIVSILFLCLNFTNLNVALFTSVR